MNEKMMIRKKAMDMEMQAKPEMPIRKREMAPAMGEEPMEGQGEEQEGMEAVLLSPEEKQMILALRKKGGMAAPEGMEDSEDPGMM